MADWRELVRERLYPLSLSAEDAEEVVLELAAHLEDLYEEKLGQGISEPEARRQAEAEVADWDRLAQRIQRIKRREELMNDRTKHIWLPGFVNLTAAMILLTPLISVSMQSRFLGRSPLQMVLLPWLCLLPLCGAAGAYLSRRAGGSLRARLVAGLFPTITMLTLGSILVVSRRLTFAHPEWRYGAMALAVAVVLPSVTLLIGAAPFFRTAKLH
jgi:hypothetical protein